MYGLDWLEQKWYVKLRSIGFGHEDGILMARVKAKMERDATFLQKIREDGFDGFCRWVEIHCKDIYYAVRGALQTAWNWLKGCF